jgi:excisionase family DNA binding protein
VTIKFQDDWEGAPLLFTIEQAAKLLSLSERTVERLLFRRELISRKIGGATRIPRDSLIAFCRKDHKTQPKT